MTKDRGTILNNSTDCLCRIHETGFSWLKKHMNSREMSLNHLWNNPETIDSKANKRDTGLALLNDEEAQLLRKDVISHTISSETERLLLQESFWTKEKLIDMIFQRIAIFKCVVRERSGKEIQFPKYLLQADYLAPRFAICKPPPVFGLNLTDLGPEIIQRLFMLDEDARGKVILEAVARIFRKLFPFYYNQSIAEFLQVEVIE